MNLNPKYTDFTGGLAYKKHYNLLTNVNKKYHFYLILTLYVIYLYLIKNNTLKHDKFIYNRSHI